MKTEKIAILGSTGHIAKGLIDNLSGRYELACYSRSKDRPLGLFPYEESDVVINCIGVGEKLWTDAYEIFRITEMYDNLCIDYIRKRSNVLYINFSSGAVFGGGYFHPVTAGTVHSVIDMNHLGECAMAYQLAKLNAEAKHRALKDLNICDIRVFSYFSRHLSPDSRCFMNEIFACIRTGTGLIVSPHEFYRDYIHPKDLAQLVEKCIAVRHLNAAFDAYSRRPARKFEILDFFTYYPHNFGLRYRINENFPETSPTGTKQNYYSINLAAQEIGYQPEYEAMDAIREETEVLLTASPRPHVDSDSDVSASPRRLSVAESASPRPRVATTEGTA